MDFGFDRLSKEAEKVVKKTLDHLPSGIREKAMLIPVTLEATPTPDMIDDGITEDTLGLFVGESFEDAGHTLNPMPGQIILFVENLWGFAERDPRAFREEVRITFMHELGHYFGWDEEDLYIRGLD